MNVIGTIDIYYKIHKVFSIDPHSHTKNLIDFLDYFVYEIHNEKADINRKLHEIGDKLLKMSIK